MTTLTDYAAKVKEMKERPIIFSTEMVKAILEGRKSQTRRIVKSKKADAPDGYEKRNGIFYEYDYHADHYNEDIIKCPYGQIGDILWVRETWKDFASKGNGRDYSYKADDLIGELGVKWKSPIHMPKEACRLRLKITDIRVERLQDISEEDAIKEGVRFTDFGKTKYGQQNRGFHIFDVNHTDQCLATARTAFGNFWEKINGKESWYANPWVWVISFKRLEKELDALTSEILEGKENNQMKLL